MSSLTASGVAFPRAMALAGAKAECLRIRRNALKVVRYLCRARGGSWLRKSWPCPIRKVSGRAALPQRVGLSEKAARNALAALVAVGLLTVEASAGHRQCGRSLATPQGVVCEPTFYRFSDDMIRMIDGSPDRFTKGRREKAQALEFSLTGAGETEVSRVRHGPFKARQPVPNGPPRVPIPAGGLSGVFDARQEPEKPPPTVQGESFTLSAAALRIVNKGSRFP